MSWVQAMTGFVFLERLELKEVKSLSTLSRVRSTHSRALSTIIRLSERVNHPPSHVHVASNHPDCGGCPGSCPGSSRITPASDELFKLGLHSPTSRSHALDLHSPTSISHTCCDLIPKQLTNLTCVVVHRTASCKTISGLETRVHPAC